MNKNYVSINIEFELPDGVDLEKLTTNDIIDLFYKYHWANKDLQTKVNAEETEFAEELKSNPIVKFLMWDAWLASRIYNLKKECIDKGKKANIETLKIPQKNIDELTEENYHELLDVIRDIFYHVETKKNKGKLE